MTVFIAHAKADAAAAESLKTVLDLRGLRAELETGERGFRPLGAMDAVVALWSKESPFDLYRLQFEKRALDAWAEGRLIVVKLDPFFAPVGLRDLPFVDAMFDKQRDLVAWPEVAKRAAEATRPQPPAPAPSGAEDDFRGGSGPPVPRKKKAADADDLAKVEPSAGKGPGVFGRLAAALVVGVIAAAVAAFLQMQLGGGLDARAVVLSLIVGGLFFAIVALTAFLGSQPVAKKVASAGSGRIAEMSAEEAPAAAPVPDAVFISYAHRDAPVVLPVCDALQDQGKSLWIDREGLEAGDSWAGEIVRAIRAARGVAVMCSKAAFESDHVKREVYLADRYKKRLLPVLIDDTPMPDDFEFFFAGVQWLKLHETPEADRPAAMARALAI